MESEYFGIIKEEDFINWELTDQEVYLVENKLFQKKGVLKLDMKLDDLLIGQIKAGGFVSNIVEVCNPIQEVLEDFYNFLLDIYKGGLGGEYIIFCRDFEKKTFGKPIEKKRKYAVKQFIKLFEMICPEVHQSLDRKNKENGLMKFNNRFEALHNLRKSNILSFSDEMDLLLQFLIGNRIFFNRNLFETSESIRDVFKFENNLITLVNLNKEFDIEIDNYFSQIPSSKADILFDAFESKVENDVVRFIDECISEIKVSHHSNIVALHRLLIDEKQIKGVTELNFRNAINSTYNLDLSRLKVSESAQEKHPERVGFYKKKWLSFSKSDS